MKAFVFMADYDDGTGDTLQVVFADTEKEAWRRFLKDFNEGLEKDEMATLSQVKKDWRVETQASVPRRKLESL